MELQELVDLIIDICKKNNLNKVYICGNGSSGKTTLSKALHEKASLIDRCNLISLDDYLVDINLRKNSLYTWYDGSKKHQGRYTSSCLESYFLKGVYEELYNIDNGLECFHLPYRYYEKDKIRKLYPNYFLTILEGVGTCFLDKDESKSLTILLKCNKTEEIKRRKQRTLELKRDASELYDATRDKEFSLNVLSKEDTFDLVLISDEDYHYHIVKKGLDKVKKWKNK